MFCAFLQPYHNSSEDNVAVVCDIYACVCVFCFSQGKTSPPTLVFNRLFSDIKEEPGHPTLVHPRYYTLLTLIKQHQYIILGLQLRVIFIIVFLSKGYFFN